MAKANPYDPSDVSVAPSYTVTTTGDRLFIPVNTDASTADQLAQCVKVSPNAIEAVAV